MQRFRFDNPYEHRWIETQLRDLSVALSGQSDLHVEYRQHSVWSPLRNTLHISTFFEALPLLDRTAIQKGDVYLRVVGNRLDTDYSEVRQLRDWSESCSFPVFARQLFCMSEDFRLATYIVSTRPGTRTSFIKRSGAYARWLQMNRQKRLRDGALLDVLFTDMYTYVHNHSSITQECEWIECAANDEGFPSPRKVMDVSTQLVDVRSTAEAYTAVQSVYRQLDLEHRIASSDLSHPLFDMDWMVTADVISDKEKLCRRRDVPHGDQISAKDAPPKNDTYEQMEIWHQDSESDAPASLLMDLNENDGTSTDGSNARLSGDDVDSFAVKRGRSGQGNTVYDDGTEDKRTDMEADASAPEQNPDRSRVTYQTVHRKSPNPDARTAVTRWHQEMHAIEHRLKKTFDSALLHRTDFRQSGKRHGRLDRRLTRLWTEAYPKLFYHKAVDDRQIDAAVQFLVDCSGSMYARLDEVKPYIYLMHEVLRHMSVPHDVCGFWEDTGGTTVRHTPDLITKLCHVITWSDWFRWDVSQYLDQLTPQLDNRDGFAIRTIGKELLRRREKQKWLIVLSDGEPAADDYRDALSDTRLAVRSLERLGVYVLHFCLYDSALNSTQMATLRQLYGNGSIILPSMEQLPGAVERTVRMMMKEAVR